MNSGGEMKKTEQPSAEDQWRTVERLRGPEFGLGTGWAEHHVFQRGVTDADLDAWTEYGKQSGRRLMMHWLARVKHPREVPGRGRSLAPERDCEPTERQRLIDQICDKQVAHFLDLKGRKWLISRNGLWDDQNKTAYPWGSLDDGQIETIHGRMGG
jgi:hypothetical protein